MFFRTFGLVTLCVTLTACNITGTAQKGPFKAGSTISTTQLDSQASPISSTTINTQVSGTQGVFSVNRIRWSGWTELVATGQYFDEYENADSDSALTLNAITNKNRRFDTANINLLTHLAAARMRQRVADGQNRFSAWRSTQTEIKQVFDLQGVSTNINRGVEQLNLLTGNGSFRSDNANLLLFTGAFLATGGNDSSLESLADDFADDAQFNGVGVNIFNNIAIKAGETGLLEKLSNNLRENGARNPPNDGDMNALPSWVNTDVVVDTVPPVITITGQTTVTIEEGTPYNDEGATAIDDIDGDVAAIAVDGSDIIDTSVAGEFIVSYEATDIAGNIATATRTVNVVEGADNEPPILTLLGDNPDQVEVDTNGDFFYQDPSYTVIDNRDEVVNVIVDGEVNIGVLGEYTLTYNATDAAGNETIKTRIVNVVDTIPPEIELIGSNPHELFTDTSEIPEPYEDLGVTVTDNYDAEISFELDLGELDLSNAGTYIITYTAQDSSGNQAIVVEREVIVTDAPDTTAPVITLLGDATVSLVEGTNYTDAGATALDNKDGDITSSIVIGGDTVNTEVPGIYTITYNVVDAANNAATTVSRTVTVTEAPAITNIRITTADGVELSGVSATTSEGSELSSGNGTVSLVLTPNQEYVLTLNKEGFATQVSPIKAPLAGEQISLDFTMIQRGAVQKFEAESGGVITGANGASVTIEQNSFVIGDGQFVTGDIDVTITPVDVSNPASLAAFPGEFTGTQLDGTDTPIISFGTVEYTFTQNGQEVRLAEGATADILIPIYVANYQNGSAIQVGQQIPLWSLNEETGIWIQESVGTRSSAPGFGLVVSEPSSPTGLALQATVSHFTWWNCDVSMNAGTAEVTVTGSQAGSAVIQAVASESCNIGWRPNIVETVIGIGDTASGLSIPSDCEVCFSAELTLTSGSILNTLTQCGAVSSANANAPILINLAAPEAGPLNIEANGESELLNIQAVLGFASPRIQLRTTTAETSVSYDVSSSLPAGLSLNVINATQAEIVGVPAAAGSFSLVVQGTDSTGTETDSVTVNYSIINPVSTALPIFVNDQIYITFTGNEGPFGLGTTGPWDLNPYNIGGTSINWSLVGANVPDWLALSSDGTLAFIEDQQSEFNSWNGVVRAATSAGVAETQIWVCLSFDCPSQSTPYPGDYAINVAENTDFYPFSRTSFEIRLNQAFAEDITIEYVIRESTTEELSGQDVNVIAAASGVDFTPESGSLIIPAGTVEAYVNYGGILNYLESGPFYDSTKVFTIEISTSNSDVRLENGVGLGWINSEGIRQVD